LSLALCCDYRIAAEGTRLIPAFTDIGLAPYAGATYLLPRLIGLARATELLFEARPLHADAAERLGLVNQVVAPPMLDLSVAAVVDALAARPARALAMTKRLLRQAEALGFGDQLAAEQRAQQDLATDNPDFIEAVRASSEKRGSRFLKRPSVPIAAGRRCICAG
jgi:2-(1,2-epoxy-1,2-dihydrophenyl)acetyl-CoA isomerase